MIDAAQLSIPADCEPVEQFAVGVRASAYNWRMRQARFAKGWTQKDLAMVVGVNPSAITAVETLRRSYRRSTPITSELLQEIADALEEPIETLFPHWVPSHKVRQAVSGDVALTLSSLALIGDASDVDLIRTTLQGQLQQAISRALDTLLPIERKVLDLRFGITDRKSRTLEEVGQEFNFTRERIRQIEAKALRKLRHPSRSRVLQEFIDRKPDSRDSYL